MIELQRVAVLVGYKSVILHVHLHMYITCIYKHACLCIPLGNGERDSQ